MNDYLATMEEKVVIVNAANEITDVVPRSVMRADILLHRASYVIVTNSKGEILVQKRSDRKDLYPSYFDPTTGGVVTENESYEQNAFRELEEEVGITGVTLKSLFDIHFENEYVKVWGHVFLTTYDGTIKPMDGEVVDFFFLEPEELKTFMKQEHIMPDGEMVIKRYLEME